jgi:hypothetical protein
MSSLVPGRLPTRYLWSVYARYLFRRICRRKSLRRLSWRLVRDRYMDLYIVHSLSRDGAHYLSRPRRHMSTIHRPFFNERTLRLLSHCIQCLCIQKLYRCSGQRIRIASGCSLPSSDSYLEKLHRISNLSLRRVQLHYSLLRTGAANSSWKLPARIQCSVQIRWLDNSHLCPATGHNWPPNHLYYPIQYNK